MLEFLNISHKYDKKLILNDFSMKLDTGEVVSLLGPSGCGKTTLLKLASGIEKIQKGEIKLNDEIVSSLNFHLNSDKRQVGYVFQDCALFPHLTVLQNIFFGIKKKDIERCLQKIKNLMDEIDISNLDVPEELKGEYECSTLGNATYYFDLENRYYVGADIKMVMNVMMDSETENEDDFGMFMKMKSDNIFKIRLEKIEE